MIDFYLSDMAPERYTERRRSSGTSTILSAKDGFTPHIPSSSFYTSPTPSNQQRMQNSAGIQAASLSINSQSPSMYMLNQGSVSPKTSTANGYNCHKASIVPLQIQMPGTPGSALSINRENRKKAVITVDAKTTEVGF